MLKPIALNNYLKFIFKINIYIFIKLCYYKNDTSDDDTSQREIFMIKNNKFFALSVVASLFLSIGYLQAATGVGGGVGTGGGLNGDGGVLVTAGLTSGTATDSGGTGGGIGAPEPTTMIILGSGLAMAYMARKKQAKE